MKLDLKLLIATVIAGLAGFFAVQVLYGMLADDMAMPVLMAVLITVFALICCVTISAVVMITGRTDDEFLFLHSRKMLFLGLAICMVVLFLLAMLFEWIYDHDEVAVLGPSSYVFILDESGSMDQNDPNYQRYEAVESVVNMMPDNTPYAVYIFSNGCLRIRDMALPSAGMVKRPDEAGDAMGGKTYISEALSVVYEDLESGAVQGGTDPQVILLTDGYASDMNSFFGKGILNDYENAGIAVSTVGLGDVDETLLNEIADTTKGQYVLVADADKLEQGFASAAYQQSSRNLISPRDELENDGLYLFLRVLFLTLIGCAIAFMKAMVCAGDSTGLIMIEGSAAALVAAILMELGLAIGLPTFLCRFVYWMALAVTPQMVVYKIVRTSGNRKVRTADDMLFGGAGSNIKW